MQKASFRAAAILTAAEGKEQELLDFCREVLPRLREVDGLQNVELSQSVTEDAQLLLFYWWESAEASAKYMEGDVYRELAPKISSLLSAHTLVVAQAVEA